MNITAVLVAVSVFCFGFAVTEARQQKRSRGGTQPQVRKSAPTSKPAPLKAQPLQPEEAFAVLRELHEKGKVTLAMVGEMVRKMGFRYTGLAKEHCFGWQIAGEKRVVGESSGGFYGVGYTSDSTGEKKFQMIGLIHSDTDLSIEGKQLKAGIYVLYAASDALVLDNKEKDISAGLLFPLKQALSPSLFLNEKGGKSPRYTLAFEEGSLWIVIGNNHLRLSLAVNGNAGVAPQQKQQEPSQQEVLMRKHSVEIEQKG